MPFCSKSPAARGTGLLTCLSAGQCPLSAEDPEINDHGAGGIADGQHQNKHYRSCNKNLERIQAGGKTIKKAMAKAPAQKAMDKLAAIILIIGRILIFKYYFLPDIHIQAAPSSH